MTHDDQKQEGIEAQEQELMMKRMVEDEEYARECMAMPRSDDPLVNVLLSIVGASMAPYRAKNKGPDNARPLESHVTPKSLSDEARTSND